MCGRILVVLLAMAALFAGGCSQNDASAGPVAVPGVVTADIQAGIEAYIEKKTQSGGGYFDLLFENKDLRLKLVRVHTEYLANLGPRRHFACVDLVDTSGDVYDVDFFLSGDPGAMEVTETTVHKINGQPLYLWEQDAKEHTWHRVAAEHASDGLLGVVRVRDEFEFMYCAMLPKLDGPARMWLPMACSDAFQSIAIGGIQAPGTRRILEEKAHGNKILFLELGPADSGKTISIQYNVQRVEKAAYAASETEAAPYLAPERLVPADAHFKKIAEDIVAGKKGDLVRARALYDHVIDRLRYAKAGIGWGKGDAVYACDARGGNCTDFHAYFIALARAVGIPARFAIGAAVPSERDEGGVDGYHCWAEFFAEGKWWPVDISEADKYASLSTYYFGHHPANRVEFSRGRDLMVDPAPTSGPINFLAYPVLEVSGQLSKATVQFTFKRMVPHLGALSQD